MVKLEQNRVNTPDTTKKFSNQLINWYLKNKRELPWRETTDPYKIWLSEIILQQTRVQQGLPYYNSFLNTFPTIKKMAEASEKDILSLWQGLGYYSRARNLHKTAQIVQHTYKGVFPKTYKELLLLKGVGPYTAAAIASFAYKEKVAVVDGNVYRVLARIFGVYEDITQNSSKKTFAELAQGLIPEKQPDIYNQAIMEFGALHYTPSDPDCEHCPFAGICIANSTGDQAILPVKTKQSKKQERFFQYFIFTYDNKLLMKERTGKDIWQGLFEFLLIESDKLEALSSLLKKINGVAKKDVLFESPLYKHILSHQILHARFYHIQADKKLFHLLKEKYKLESIDKAEINDTPKPVLLSKFLKDHKF